MKLSKEELLRERSRILGYGAAELGKANIELTKQGRDVAVMLWGQDTVENALRPYLTELREGINASLRANEAALLKNEKSVLQCALYR